MTNCCCTWLNVNNKTGSKISHTYRINKRTEQKRHPILCDKVLIYFPFSMSNSNDVVTCLFICVHINNCIAITSVMFLLIVAVDYIFLKHFNDPPPIYLYNYNTDYIHDITFLSCANLGKFYLHHGCPGLAGKTREWTS